MKAFLCHSSLDKHFVGAVFKALGQSQAEYDEQTFSYTFNVAAIRDALKRCDLFVMFLSAASVESTFVTEEQRAALEHRGRGLIKRIIVFAIDDTSFNRLPEWMHDINIVHKLASAKSVARRIQSLLWSAAVEEDKSHDLYIGRDEDRRVIRKALAVPPKETPIAIHMVGFYGVGRRTLLRRSLQEFLPRVADLFVEITAGRFEGNEELYRQLYELHVHSSLSKKILDLEAFSRCSEETQSLMLVEILNELRSDHTFIIIMDDGGVYDDEGDYQPHFKRMLLGLTDAGQPAIGVVQTRMMPFTLRDSYSRTFHHSVRSLDDDSTKELLSLSLKQRNIDFTTSDISTICEHLDGHPFNVRFAVKYIENYGIASLTRDPSGLVDWKNKRAEDFLSRVEFGELEADILAALNDFVFLSSDVIYSILNTSQMEIAGSLRKLEEFCCVERREGYFHISAPLRGAVRRDRRFERTSEWRRGVAVAVCEVIEDYSDTDHVPISIIESATVAAVQGAKAPPFIERLILPSHLLKIAREHYGNRKYGPCLRFCEQALQYGDRLTMEGKVEAYRLQGLSAVRISDDEAYNRSTDGLNAMGNWRSAKRNLHFLRGYRSRVRGSLDDAEAEFLQAWKYGRDNQSTNRELASLYCRQELYAEAEGYARAALRLQPTNPYILDIMAEVLVGRRSSGEGVDNDEVNRIMEDLRVHGDAPGLSFYLVRQANRLSKEGQVKQALDQANKAVKRSNGLVAPLFVRAAIHLKLGDPSAAEGDVVLIEDLLRDAGGFSREEEAHLDELKVKILSDKGLFSVAKDVIERSAFMSGRMKDRARRSLAKIIKAGGIPVSTDLKGWAEGALKAPPFIPGQPAARRRSGRRKR